MSIEKDDDIQNQVKYSGTTITIKDIEKTLKDLYLNTKQQTRQFNLYTGLKGAEMFNFIMMFGDSFVCSYWFNNFKKSTGIKKFTFYLNVIRKHSLYKVLIERENNEYKFFLMKGTEIISYHYNIKSLNVQLAKLDQEADLEDLKRKQEREIRIANYSKNG